MAGGDLVQRAEDAQAARVEIFLHAAAARAFAEIGLGAVLARQETAGEAVVSDDSEPLGHAQLTQLAVVTRPVVEIVFRLQHLVARQAAQLRHVERRPQLAGIEVGRADGADLACLDEPVVGAERFLVGRRRVGPVRKIEVDGLDLQAAQRVLHRLLDIGGGQVLPALPHVGADLGDDNHLVAAFAVPHPFADDGLGFAALVSGNPARIGIGRIDRVEAGIDEPVEQVERGLLVGGPAEHVAAKDERGDFEAGLAEGALLQGLAPCLGRTEGIGAMRRETSPGGMAFKARSRFPDQVRLPASGNALPEFGNRRATASSQ